MKRNRSSIAWVLVPLDATARSSVIEGIDDHRLVVMVEPHRLPDLVHPVLEPVEALVSLVLVQPGQQVGPDGRRRPDVAAHDTIRALSMPLTSKAWMLRLNPRSSRIAGVLGHRDRPGGGEHAFGDEDLPRVGVSAQAGGEVGDTADRGVVVAPLETDPAQGRVALRDPDAEREVVTLAGPRLREALDPRAHRDRHPDRARRSVVAPHRVVEEHHQAVAGEPLEGAFEPEDQVAEAQ